MQDILFEYEMHPTTWVYVSALMTIGIYFKFRRFWSVRNLDLIGLVAFAPGLLLVSHQQEQLGFLWLFIVTGFFLVRLLLDPVMVRRPLLEPNLSASGLTFMGAALLVFLFANVITNKVPSSIPSGTEQAQAAHGNADAPGHPWFHAIVDFAREEVASDNGDRQDLSRRSLVRQATVRTAAIIAHLAVVIGMVMIGYWHFDNIHTGVAAASLYLLLPYTAQMTGHVDHVVPAALLTWAVAAYRRPLAAGVLIALAAGTIFYPWFLLPLWLGFYWRRGLVRFSIGVTAALLVLVISLMFAATESAPLSTQLQEMFGCTSLLPRNMSGFWEDHDTAFRIPVLAAYVALCASLALWPAHKNLGTLLSCSAVVMVAAQFWHATGGGLFMAWYLPLLILTIFRPNLEDRVALTALTTGWIPWRKPIAGMEGG